MVNDSQDESEIRPPGAPAESRFPRLWRLVNSSSSGHPFDSDVPLPRLEPPKLVPSLDPSRDESRPSAHESRGLPLTRPFKGTPGAIAPMSPERSEAKLVSSSLRRVPRPLLFAAALAGVGLLLGASLMFLGGKDSSDSGVTSGATRKSATDSGSSGVETSTASLIEGDCIIIGEFDSASPFHTNVSKVACERRHDAEVVAVTSTPMDLHEEIDPADIASTADFLCATEFEAYGVDRGIDDRVELAPLVGSRRSLLVCVARYPKGRQFINPTVSLNGPEPGK